MTFSRVGWLILSLGVFPGAIAAASGNHCEAIRKNKNKCEGLEGQGLEGVKEKCKALLKKQQNARDLAKSSCGEEAKSVAGKKSCMSSAYSQSDLDSCNAAADNSMHGSISSSAEKQRAAAEEVKKAREELNDEIEKAKQDPDVDKSKLSKAEKVGKESRELIESDISGLAADDQQAADSFGGLGDTGNGNSSSLDALAPSDPSMGNLASADGLSGPSTSDANLGELPNTQLAFSPTSDGAAASSDAGAQTLASPAFFSGTAAAAPASDAPVTAAVAPTVAPSGVATPASPGAEAVTPVNVGTNGVGSAGAANRIASLGSGSQGASLASAPAEQTKAGADANGLRDELRRKMLSPLGRNEQAGSYASQSDSSSVANEQRIDGSGEVGPGRSPSSLAQGNEENGVSASLAAPEALEPFSSSLAGPRFSLMSSETEASVKKMVRELSNAAGGPQGSPEEIGERNGPTLFARSHAVIERSLRKGYVRGVAAR